MIKEQPNIKFIDEMSGGNADIKKQIIEILIEEFPKEKDDYLSQLEDKNFLRLKEKVHKLKNKINILGMNKSYDIAIEYENNLRLNSFELSSEFHNILDIITNFLKNLEFSE